MVQEIDFHTDFRGVGATAVFSNVQMVGDTVIVIVTIYDVC